MSSPAISPRTFTVSGSTWRPSLFTRGCGAALLCLRALDRMQSISLIVLASSPETATKLDVPSYRNVLEEQAEALPVEVIVAYWNADGHPPQGPADPAIPHVQGDGLLGAPGWNQGGLWRSLDRTRFGQVLSFFRTCPGRRSAQRPGSRSGDCRSEAAKRTSLVAGSPMALPGACGRSEPGHVRRFLRAHGRSPLNLYRCSHDPQCTGITARPRSSGLDLRGASRCRRRCAAR